jgi:hypothetical protein
MLNEIFTAIKDTIDPEKGGGISETFICIISVVIIIGMFVLETMGHQTPSELKVALTMALGFMIGKNTKSTTESNQEANNNDTTGTRY